MPSLCSPAGRIGLILAALVLAAPNLGAAPFRVAIAVAPGFSSWTSLDDPEGRPVRLALTDGLLGFDPVTGLVKPGLATSWSAAEGGRVWTFTLTAALWSDGSPVTSGDFATAWGRAGVAVRTDTSDPRRLVAVFAEPLADVAVLTGSRYLLYPEAGRGPGPFLPASEEPGKSLSLVRNPRFREAKSVRLDSLRFLFTSSLTEAGDLFREGGADWVPRGGGPGTFGEPGLSRAVTSPGWGTVLLRFNLRSARLGDPAYRQGLVDALDRAALVRGLRGPVLVPAFSFVPRTEPAPPKTPASKVRPAPRFGPAPEPTLTILHPVGESYRSIAEGVADQWRRKLGISVDTLAAPYAQVARSRAAGHFEVVLTAWLGDYPDPAAFLGVFRSGRPENDMGYGDPGFDSAFDRLITLVPGKERTAEVARAQDLLAATWPAVPLFSYAWVNQIDLRRWSGWTANPTDIHPWQGFGPKK